MLHGCGQERIPSGSRARRPLVQHLLLFFSPERPEVPGQVVQDRPRKVSVGPPGTYRVAVIAECDTGRFAGVSCRVHRDLVRSRGSSLRFDFAAGQLPVTLLQDSGSGVSLEIPSAPASRDGP